MKPIFVRLISSLLFVFLGSSMSPTFHAQMQSDSRALGSGTILETDSEGIWRIDLASKTRTQYYRFPSDVRFQGYFIDFQEQYLYAVEVPDSTNWWQWQFGTFNLVKIDLLTAEKTVLYTGEDIGIDGHYANSKDYIMLARFPRDYVRTQHPSQVCLLDLRTLVCEQISEVAILTLYFPNPKVEIWLNFSTFTTGNRIINILTGETQAILEKWIVYQLVPFRGVNKVLVVAHLNDGTFPDETGAGFYILDTETFQLSEKLCDVPLFTNVFIPRLSFDGRKVVYFRQNHSDGENTILDLETCQSITTAAYLTWLSDSRNLIGTVRDDPNTEHRTVVRVNADTSEIETLFETNEQVSFTVVP